MGYIERPTQPSETAGWAYPFLIAGSLGVFSSLLMLLVGLAFMEGETGNQIGFTLIILVPVGFYVAAVVGVFRGWHASGVALLTLPAIAMILVWFF